MERRWRDGEGILTQAFSFNGEPQAKESAANDGCGLPFKQLNRQSTSGLLI